MMGKVFSMGGIQHLGMPAYFSFSFYIVTAISSTKVDFSLIITPIFIFALEFLESHSNLMNIKNSQQELNARACKLPVDLVIFFCYLQCQTNFDPNTRFCNNKVGGRGGGGITHNYHSPLRY
jgi:hypothetical protein